MRHALAQRMAVVFGQPFFDTHENRIDPSFVPTNLAVDGADSFSVDGLACSRAGPWTQVGAAEYLLRAPARCASVS